MKKIELKIIALSHSITHSQSYAVVLGEVEGSRRLPIVIGGFEAQSIAIALENMAPSRPLTHDLMKNMFDAFDIELKEVLINNLADGIFYSQLVCKQGKNIIEIDSRTSDALALALRVKCPIYTYDFIIESAGILTDDPDDASPTGEYESSAAEEEETKVVKKDKPLKEYSDTELNSLLDEKLACEDYEYAIKIRDEISKREEKKDKN